MKAHWVPGPALNIRPDPAAQTPTEASPMGWPNQIPTTRPAQLDEEPHMLGISGAARKNRLINRAHLRIAHAGGEAGASGFERARCGLEDFQVDLFEGGREHLGVVKLRDLRFLPRVGNFFHAQNRWPTAPRPPLVNQSSQFLFKKQR